MSEENVDTLISKLVRVASFHLKGMMSKADVHVAYKSAIEKGVTKEQILDYVSVYGDANFAKKSEAEQVRIQTAMYDLINTL